MINIKTENASDTLAYCNTMYVLQHNASMYLTIVELKFAIYVGGIEVGQSKAPPFIADGLSATMMLLGFLVSCMDLRHTSLQNHVKRLTKYTWSNEQDLDAFGKMQLAVLAQLQVWKEIR